MGKGTIGDRLREERRAKGLNQSDFGQIGGVSVKSQSAYESNARKPDAEYFQRVAEYGVDIAFVITGGASPRTGVVGSSGGMVGSVGDRRARPQRGPDDQADVLLEDYQWVPLYDVEVSGGDGRIADAEQLKELNPYRKNYLAKRGLLGAPLIEVTVVGDSMAAELRDGDTVLVDTSDTQIKGGAIYVVRIGDDMLVKYLQQLPGGAVQVSSENAHAFPPYVVAAPAADHDLVVVGRVRHQGRDR